MYIAGRNAHGHLENSLPVLHKIKYRLLYDTEILYIPQRVENRYSNMNLCNNVYSSIIHNSKCPSQVSINKWVDIQMYIPTKWKIISHKKKVLMYAAIQMNLKTWNHMKKNRNEKKLLLWFYLYGIFSRGKFIETKNRLELTLSWEDRGILFYLCCYNRIFEIG